MRTICKYKEICNSLGDKCKVCLHNTYDPKEDYFKPKPKEYEAMFE